MTAPPTTTKLILKRPVHEAAWGVVLEIVGDSLLADPHYSADLFSYLVFYPWRRGVHKITFKGAALTDKQVIGIYGWHLRLRKGDPDSSHGLHQLFFPRPITLEVFMHSVGRFSLQVGFQNATLDLVKWEKNKARSILRRFELTVEIETNQEPAPLFDLNEEQEFAEVLTWNDFMHAIDLAKEFGVLAWVICDPIHFVRHELQNLLAQVAKEWDMLATLGGWWIFDGQRFMQYEQHTSMKFAAFTCLGFQFNKKYIALKQAERDPVYLRTAPNVAITTGGALDGTFPLQNPYGPSQANWMFAGSDLVRESFWPTTPVIDSPNWLKQPELSVFDSPDKVLVNPRELASYLAEANAYGFKFLRLRSPQEAIRDLIQVAVRWLEVKHVNELAVADKAQIAFWKMNGDLNLVILVSYETAIAEALHITISSTPKIVIFVPTLVKDLPATGTLPLQQAVQWIDDNCRLRADTWPKTPHSDLDQTVSVLPALEGKMATMTLKDRKEEPFFAINVPLARSRTHMCLQAQIWSQLYSPETTVLPTAILDCSVIFEEHSEHSLLVILDVRSRTTANPLNPLQALLICRWLHKNAPGSIPLRGITPLMPAKTNPNFENSELGKFTLSPLGFSWPDLQLMFGRAMQDELASALLYFDHVQIQPVLITNGLKIPLLMQQRRPAFTPAALAQSLFFENFTSECRMRVAFLARTPLLRYDANRVQFGFFPDPPKKLYPALRDLYFFPEHSYPMVRLNNDEIYESLDKRLKVANLDQFNYILSTILSAGVKIDDSFVVLAALKGYLFDSVFLEHPDLIRYLRLLNIKDTQNAINQPYVNVLQMQQNTSLNIDIPYDFYNVGPKLAAALDSVVRRGIPVIFYVYP